MKKNDSKGRDAKAHRQVKLAHLRRRWAKQTETRGTLIYNGPRINSSRFRPKGKDLRKLVGYCSLCGRRLRGKAAIPKPDPFSEDVLNDKTPVVECESCRQDRADEI